MVKHRFRRARRRVASLAPARRVRTVYRRAKAYRRRKSSSGGGGGRFGINNLSTVAGFLTGYTGAQIHPSQTLVALGLATAEIIPGVGKLVPKFLSNAGKGYVLSRVVGEVAADRAVELPYYNHFLVKEESSKHSVDYYGYGHIL